MATKIVAAVLYLRMSSRGQELSIGQQRDELIKFAARQGYKVVAEYEDQAISGDATEKRLAFLKMRDDSAGGTFEVVLAWDQDRFGRFDPIEGGYWIKPFRDAGVRLETVAQGKIDWTDFTGRVVYMIQQEAKHQFLRDLSRNVTRGLIKRAEQGLWTGNIPYGYERGDDGRLVVGDPKEVETVRTIFSLRLKGLGYRGIARRLNDQKAPSPSGGKWTHDAVRIVLARPTYVGTVTSGALSQGKYHTTNGGEVHAVRKGKAKVTTVPLVVEHAHPAIVDQETFDKAQAMRSKAKPHCREGRGGSPLAGLLVCGCCGKPMYAQSLQRASGQTNPNYVCSTYHKGRGCGYCVVPQAGILEAVAHAIKSRLLRGSRKALEKAIEKEIDRKVEPTTSKADKATLAKRLDTLDKQIDKASERLLKVDDRLVPDLERRLLDLRQQRDEIKVRLDDTQRTSKSKLDAKKIADELWRLGDVLKESDPVEIRSALSTAIERIVLDFTPGKKHGRGQKYELVGGSIVCTKAWGCLGSCP